VSAITHEKLKVTSPFDISTEGRDYTICGKSAELVKGEIVFKYKACLPICISVPTSHNDKITGLSLTGTVTKTANETVELLPGIDEDKPNGSYPYAWAPATGNLVYCMPRVRTNFKNNTPNGYRQDEIMDLFHENAKIANDFQKETILNYNVGVKMGLPHIVYQNFLTTDNKDAYWVQYRIDMAESGR
jgi:hypothetical protein